MDDMAGQWIGAIALAAMAFTFHFLCNPSDAAMAIPSNLLSFFRYYRRFSGKLLAEVYHSGRQYVFSTVVIAALSFALGKAGDASNWTALTITLKACGIFLALFALFHIVRTPWKLDQDRQFQFDKSSKDQPADETLRPFAVVRFAYEYGDNSACLYIKNAGIVADFFAQLRGVDGQADVHARWAHTFDVKTRIPNGLECKLLLAKLHYTTGPVRMSQWEILYTREKLGIGSRMATYSSAVGIPDGQAPDINLEVIIASDPDMSGGVQSKRIVLHSNRAEELP